MPEVCGFSVALRFWFLVLLWSWSGGAQWMRWRGGARLSEVE